MPSDKALYTYPVYDTYFLARGDNKVTCGDTKLEGSFFTYYGGSVFSSLNHSLLKYVLPLELML